MVECHMGTGVMAKSQETMVWTETATGTMTMDMMCIAVSRRCHWRGVPAADAAAFAEKSSGCKDRHSGTIQNGLR